MILQYDPQSLQYTVGMLCNSFQGKRKVDLICDINTIQIAYGKGELTEEQFNALYDSPIKDLIYIVKSHASMLSPIHSA